MRLILVFIVIVLMAGIVGYMMVGAGGFKRTFTIAGIYAICKPEGYDVVCFLDSAGRDGGVSCVSLTLAGGACRK